MNYFPKSINLTAIGLLLFAALYMLGLQFSPVQAQAELLGISERCTIPDSGPWPPCATGGSATPSTDCVIPDSGPWPPCATSGDSTPAAGNSNDCVIPASGPWPACATDGNAPSTPSDTSDCVIPESGPWPSCASGGTPPATPSPTPEPQPEPEPAPQSGNYAITDVEILETDAYNIHGRFYQVNMQEGFQPLYAVLDPDFCVRDDDCGNNIGNYRIIGFDTPEDPPTTGWIDFTVDIDNLICPYQPHSKRFWIAIADANADWRNRVYEVVFEFEFDHKWCE